MTGNNLMTIGAMHALRDAVHDVYIDDVVRRWLIRLVRATREAEGVAIGVLQPDGNVDLARMRELIAAVTSKRNECPF